MFERKPVVRDTLRCFWVFLGYSMAPGRSKSQLLMRAYARQARKGEHFRLG